MIITRKQAKSEGKAKYFTGKQCKNMHIAERYVVNGHCTVCSYERSTRQDVKEKVTASKEKNWRERAEYQLKWAERNKDKKSAYMRSYNKEKYATGEPRRKYHSDPLTNLIQRSRSRVTRAFKQGGYTKNNPTQTLIGCSWEFLKLHIERQFTKGMSWENRNKWHIDHIVPTSSAATEDELLKLFHFTNLRPLWAKDNLRKSSKNEVLL